MASDDNTPAPRSGLDSYFTDYFVLAIIVSVCCNIVALVLNIVGVVTCNDPQAKKNATICLIIWAVLHTIGLILRFAGVFGHILSR